MVSLNCVQIFAKKKLSPPGTSPFHLLVLLPPPQKKIVISPMCGSAVVVEVSGKRQVRIYLQVREHFKLLFFTLLTKQSINDKVEN